MNPALRIVCIAFATLSLIPGDKASDYRRLTIRLPPEMLAELDAAGRATGQPQWRVIVTAVSPKIYV